MFIIYMIHPINILISSFLYYEIITGSNKEKSVKQLKYDACYKLVQSRAEQDKRHFKELSSILKPEEINNILQYSLFECYQNIVYNDAEYVDDNIKEINLYEEKYIELLNFEKWENLIQKKDENEIQYAVMELQRAYRDIQSGEIKIKKYNKKQNKQNNEIYKKINYEDIYGKNEEDVNEYYFPHDFGLDDFELFGVDFSKLSPKIKNVVGFGLIIFVFVCIIIGLRWIQNIRDKNNGNKKKKNKKEKKKQK